MDYSLDYPDISVYEMLSTSASRYPSNIAVNYYGNKISYQALLSETDKCAAALKCAGCCTGDHVAVILPNIPQAVMLFYACSRIGAVCDMIHPLSAVNELKAYIEASDAKVIFAFEDVLPNLAFLTGSDRKVYSVSASDYLPSLARIGFKIRSRHDKAAETSDTFKSFISRGEKELAILEDLAFTDQDEPCAMLYTGGTTGKNKGVLLTSRNFNYSAIEAIDSCGCLLPGDKLLAVLPVFHGFGLGVGVHTVMAFGGTSVLLPIFKLKRFLKLIEKYKPEVIAGVPAIFGAMIANDADVDMSFVKLVISGGDRLPPEMQRKFNDLLRRHGSEAVIRQGYGLTECLSGVCLMPPGCLKENCLGVPYKDTEICIVDTGSDESCPPGAKGEIIISGPAVMRGYLDEPEETGTALKVRSDGKTWLYTGDQGHKDEEGYVFFDSRIKRMIVTNGYNVYPSVLEDIICSCEGVRECAVAGVPDELRGEICKAYIVFDDD
ncbi:MAG: AMP-binding protein, partial [Clostridiales bacterium]|nr:AMP-binding protein [Clostridiales bacterium]